MSPAMFNPDTCVKSVTFTSTVYRAEVVVEHVNRWRGHQHLQGSIVHWLMVHESVKPEWVREYLKRRGI